MQFIKHNNNPKNRNTGDCVIRAIALATNNSWENAYRELAERGIKKGYLPNLPPIWRKYLQDLGYEKQKMPIRKDNTRYTIEEFCNEIAEPKTTYVVKVINHLTVVKDKNLYDTWNCSSRSVMSYWILKGGRNNARHG